MKLAAPIAAANRSRRQFWQALSSFSGVSALLTPEEGVLLLVDHQAFQFANLHSHEIQLVVNNVVGWHHPTRTINADADEWLATGEVENRKFSIRYRLPMQPARIGRTSLPVFKQISLCHGCRLCQLGALD
jgi:hypothetical protein